MSAHQESQAGGEPTDHRKSRIDRLRARAHHALRSRAWRIRLFGLLAVQAGIAAAIAWFVAYQFLGNPSPVLAPTTAVGIVAASMGSRLRRTIELLAGVTLGLAVGDTLMPFFGIGPWQTGVVVVLAIGVAILLKGGGSLLTQAGGTAVLIATLEPPLRELSIPRFVDAAVGGLVGLGVGLLVAPINPQRTLLRLAEPVVGPAADIMHDLATALRTRDLGDAERSLRRLRGLDPRLAALDDGLSAAQEVTRLAPLRWRERDSLDFHTTAIHHLERSLHGCRSLCRRLTTALKDDEPIPEEFPQAIDLLADALPTLRRAVQVGREPREARDKILAGVELVGRAQGFVGDPTRPHIHRLGYSGLVAVGEYRAAAHDLLITSGLETEMAAALVRQAVDQH
ncbi:FUSC family protein [Micromonospora sp. bgisy143]|uniref:FUSC family protein n=1 Tax=Micromonospora sp. bgisy143 TaxID=3413790 RepID=UPI003EB92E45